MADQYAKKTGPRRGHDNNRLREGDHIRSSAPYNRADDHIRTTNQSTNIDYSNNPTMNELRRIGQLVISEQFGQQNTYGGPHCLDKIGPVFRKTKKFERVSRCY
jgi:hypothetical protein